MPLLSLYQSPLVRERERESVRMGSKVELIKDESLNCRKRISISPQKNEEEEEEEDDGPPPGFDSLPLNLSKDIRNILNEKEVSEDDDGPPPGFQPISLINTVKVKKDGSFIENIDDNDEPPPGFQSISLKNTPENRKRESFIGNIDGDDGPPPGFHSVHVIKQVDDVSVSDSHSVFVDGLNPNFQSDVKILGDGSKLVFGSIHVKEEGNSGGGLNPIYQSDLKIVDECELGLKSVSAKEEGKNGDGIESGLKSFNLIECELGSRSYSEKGEENIIDVSELGLKSVSVEEPELRLQSISEKGKENGKEKVRDDSELGFESVSNRDLVKESDESDVGSQPVPMIEDEKEDNVCGTGLQSISQKVGREEKNDDNDDDDGPPPGWGSFLPPRPSIESSAPPHQPRSPVSPRTGLGSAHVRGEERVGDELEVGSQLDPMKEDGKEDDGSELDFQSFLVITEEKGSTPVKEEEDDNESPPSGWFSCHPSKGLNKALSPPLTLAQFDPMKEDEKERDGSELESLSFPAKTEGKGPTSVKEDEAHEGPPPGWYSCHPSKEPRKALSPLTPAPPNPLLSAISSEEKGPPPVKEQEDHEGLPPGWYSCHPSKVRSKALSPPQLPPVTPAPPNPQPSATSFGKAQMVCGSCRTLLSYSKGSRFVQCSCCQTVNLVLEEHQVGQVKCRGCTLLLMYPYGAPSVQCSSCLFVTKVGVQNKRPPLSLQQGRPQLLANPVT